MAGGPEEALTLDAALLELGVDAKATAEEARRAYLRLVKSRSPERDPLGFRRARAAYDVVRTALAMRQLAAQSQAVERVVASASRADPPTSPTDEDPASAPSADARPPAASGPAVVTIPNLSPEQQASLVLIRRAWAIGETSDWKLMLEAIGAATRWLSGPPIPVPACLFLIVTLIAEEQVKAALQLCRALGTWLEARQDAARMLDGSLAVRWLLAQELCALAPEIAPAAAAALAKALLAGELTQARGALEAASVVHGGTPIELLVQRYAPHLVEALPERYTPPAGRRPKARGGSGFPGWALVPIIVLCLRGLSGLQNCDSSPPPVYIPPSSYSPATDARALARMNVSPSPPTDDPLQRVQQLMLTRPALLGSDPEGAEPSALPPGADALASQADALGLSVLADAARALGETRRTGGCPALQPAVRALKGAVERAHNRPLRTAYRDLSAAIRRECNDQAGPHP